MNEHIATSWISQEQEKILLRQSRSNEKLERETAIARLIAAHTGFIKNRVNAIARRADAETMDVLTIAGLRGLSDAIARYDLDSDKRLTTFARKFVNGEILKQLREDGSPITRPRRALKVLRMVKEARANLHAAGKTNPTDNEIIEELQPNCGFSPKMIREALLADKAVIPIDALGRGQSETRSSDVPDEREPGPPMTLQNREELDSEEENRKWDFALEDVGFLNPHLAKRVSDILGSYGEDVDRELFDLAVKATDRCYRRRDVFAKGSRGKLDESILQILSAPSEGPGAYSRRALWKTRSTW